MTPTYDGYGPDATYTTAADHRAQRPEVLARRERDALKAQLEQAVDAARRWHQLYVTTRASLERHYRATHEIEDRR